MTLAKDSVISRVMRPILAKGPRYLMVGIVSNIFSYAVGLLLFSVLHNKLGVLLVTILSAISHTTITFTAHYLFTFSPRGRFYLGYSKALASAALFTVIFSIVTAVLIRYQIAPFWLIQAIAFCVGQAYGILTNFFWVFRKHEA